MTYKEIVDRIKDIVDRHRMVTDFGYGNLSDIKANNDGNESADYPYAFLNPTNHTRSGQAITYRFNLIVMDMAKDDNYLKIQSECQQYIDDILGNLRFGYKDQVDLTLNVTLTPFKERFQDVVAGMTATLEVVIPLRLSDCYSVAPQYLLVAEVFKESDQIHQPDAEQSPIAFTDIILDEEGGWRPPAEGGNFYRSPNGGTYRVTVTGTVSRINAGQWPTVPDLKLDSSPDYTAPTEYLWPDEVSVGEVAPWQATWDNVEITANEFFAIAFPNEPPLECALYTKAGSKIEIFKLS